MSETEKLLEALRFIALCDPSDTRSVYLMQRRAMDALNWHTVDTGGAKPNPMNAAGTNEGQKVAD